jgi:hypothetical protein
LRNLQRLGPRRARLRGGVGVRRPAHPTPDHVTLLITGLDAFNLFNDNLLVTYIQRLKSNPVAVVLAVVVLLAAAQFTDAWGGIRQVLGRFLLRGRPAATASGGGACAGRGRETAVRGYALALTNPTTLGVFVRDNDSLFAQNGDAIACYRLLAAALASNTNLTQLEALRDRAEAERQTGLEFDRSAYTIDLSGTLRELAASLPALVNADDAPYRATRAYESAHAYSTLLQRARSASEGIDALIRADEEVLRELAARLSGQ